jgi:hypothetical protein
MVEVMCQLELEDWKRRPKVPAWISAIFENVSLSESWLSIAVKLPALL